MLTDDIYERLSGPLQPSLDFYHSLFKGCEGGDYIQCFDHNRQILRRLTMSFSDLDCLPLGLLPGLEGHSGHQDSSGGECHKESRSALLFYQETIEKTSSSSVRKIGNEILVRTRLTKESRPFSSGW